MENKALGKGLSALIPEKEEATNLETVAYIKTEQISDNSLQPRTNYNDERLEELKTSIQEKGVLQPILIRETTDGYEVVAGERRLRAARSLNMQEVPAIIKNVSDQEALVIALIENIQREELNPIEEAEAFRKLIDEFQYTQDEVAQAVGKDRSTIGNLLRLLKLPDDIKQSVYEGELSVGHARALLGADSTSDMKRIFKTLIKKELSVREVEHLVSKSAQSTSRRKKANASRPPELLALEEVLQKYLGTKVNILAKKKRGKIVIEYYSFEDLERILKIIKK